MKGYYPSEHGVASIFDIRTNGGRDTASGVKLENHGNMVAHKTYPFGTKLSITNLKTRKTTTGIVVDRGPFVKGRIIDLTPGVAEKIGLTKKQGMVPVEIHVVGKAKLGK